LKAIVIDPKGNVELEDYYYRGKLTGSPNVPPGSLIDVMIDSIDPVRGELRLRKL
jgi:hypothetical protein